MRIAPRTLRGRLILALLSATVAGLFVMSGASLAFLKHSLLAKLDDQLATIAKPWKQGRPPRMPPEGPRNQELPTDFRVVVFDRKDKATQVSGRSVKDPSLPLIKPADLGSGTITVPSTIGKTDWRVHMVPWPEGGTIAVALPLDDTRLTVRELLFIELAVGAVVLVVLATVTTLIVRLGLRPLTKIEHTANAIARGELGRRVADRDSRTETGRLGAALNTMVGRLVSALRQREQSELRLRRFIADASHELRTPLTSIRGFAELYRRSDAHSDDDARMMMSRIEGDAVRMSSLVEDLLLLARLDRERTVDLTDLNLVPLARDAVDAACARDPEREITLEAAKDQVRVLGDTNKIRQTLNNLLTNALIHTTPGTVVRVRVDHGMTSKDPLASAGAEDVEGTPMGVVEIADSGPGIGLEHSERVFDRFYQVARGRNDDGTGLGLAITAAIAEAHNGRVELLSNSSGGCTFRLLLPMT